MNRYGKYKIAAAALLLATCAFVSAQPGAPAGPTPAPAALTSDPTRIEMKRVAGSLAIRLKSESAGAVSIRGYAGADGKPSPMSPGFTTVLAQEMTACGVSVVPGAEYEIGGTVVIAKDPKTDTPAIKITTTLTKKGTNASKELALCTTLLHGLEAMVDLTGTTVAFESKWDLRKRHQMAIVPGRTKVSQDKVAHPGNNDTFGVKLLVLSKNDWESVPLEASGEQGGPAIARLAKGSVIALYFQNKGPKAILAWPRFNGIPFDAHGLFSISDGVKLPVGMPVKVAPNGTYLWGWPKSTASSLKLVVGDLPAVLQVQQQSAEAMSISVMFRALDDSDKPGRSSPGVVVAGDAQDDSFELVSVPVGESIGAVSVKIELVPPAKP